MWDVLPLWITTAIRNNDRSAVDTIQCHAYLPSKHRGRAVLCFYYNTASLILDAESRAGWIGARASRLLDSPGIELSRS